MVGRDFRLRVACEADRTGSARSTAYIHRVRVRACLCATHQRVFCVRRWQARGGDDLGLGRPRSSLSASSITPKLDRDAPHAAASAQPDGSADEPSRAQRAVELLEKKQAKMTSGPWLVVLFLHDSCAFFR